MVRWTRNRVLMPALIWTALWLSGCATAVDPPPAPPPARSDDTAKMTAQPAPSSPGRRVSSLLDFETNTDLAFVDTQPQNAASIDSAVARGGTHCLALAPGTSTLIIKTPTLLAGRPFPADWTLIGAYLLSDQPITVTASFQTPGQSMISRSVAVAPGGWTPLMLDLSPLGGAARGDVGTLQFQFASNRPAAVRLDDVLLVDNQEILIDTASNSSTGWRVGRKGLNYVFEAPGRFAFAVPTAAAQAGGWAAAQACAQRASFTSSAPPRTFTVYADGRMYFGGEFRSLWRDLPDAAAQARQHAQPAEVTIPEPMGRSNRSTAGDADNDGYNESRGCYPIVARGDRIEITLSPRTPALSRPVLEIAGLAPGNLRVTMEGRLIAGAVRLPGGEVLIELPGAITRPVLINVRAQ
jgi:hypothetical protein